MSWLARLYDRRIVNVNVNIVAAGLAAMGITVGVMHFADVLGLFEKLSELHLRVFHAELFGHAFEIHTQKLIISGMTFFVDLIADVAVYYGLHWLANHMPRKTPRLVNSAYTDLSFMRDASLVQFERAILSPLLYLVALGAAEHAPAPGRKHRKGHRHRLLRRDHDLPHPPHDLDGLQRTEGGDPNGGPHHPAAGTDKEGVVTARIE